MRGSADTTDEEFSSGFWGCGGGGEEEEKNKLPSFFCANNSCGGRVEDFVRNKSVKSWRRSVEAHGFDTQRHTAIDLDDSLEKMSIVRSIGRGNAEVSLSLSEVFDRVLLLLPPETLFFFFFCVSMAEELKTKP